MATRGPGPAAATVRSVKQPAPMVGPSASAKAIRLDEGGLGSMIPGHSFIEITLRKDAK
jgi:hypothetical protein